VLLLTTALALAPAYAATLVTQTDKTELWEQITTVDGKTVACYWIQNRKGMASKVSTGLSCVTVDPTPVPVVVYKCYDKNHNHPQYELRGESLF
jgi:hypothetical protein